jgi:hypothetical protein
MISSTEQACRMCGTEVRIGWTGDGRRIALDAFDTESGPGRWRYDDDMGIYVPADDDDPPAPRSHRSRCPYVGGRYL